MRYLAGFGRVGELAVQAGAGAQHLGHLARGRGQALELAREPALEQTLEHERVQDHALESSHH